MSGSLNLSRRGSNSLNSASGKAFKGTIVNRELQSINRGQPKLRLHLLYQITAKKLSRPPCAHTIVECIFTKRCRLYICTVNHKVFQAKPHKTLFARGTPCANNPSATLQICISWVLIIKIFIQIIFWFHESFTRDSFTLLNQLILSQLSSWELLKHIENYLQNTGSFTKD